MKSKKLQKAEAQAREDAYLYGTGFVNKLTEERIDPSTVKVSRLKNGAYSVTYGEIDPKNIEVIICSN